jgi:hypothetical protein
MENKMKTLSTIVLALALFTATSFADDGHTGSGGYADDGHTGSGGYTGCTVDCPPPCTEDCPASSEGTSEEGSFIYYMNELFGEIFV